MARILGYGLNTLGAIFHSNDQFQPIANIATLPDGIIREDGMTQDSSLNGCKTAVFTVPKKSTVSMDENKDWFLIGPQVRRPNQWGHAAAGLHLEVGLGVDDNRRSEIRTTHDLILGKTVIALKKEISINRGCPKI